MDIRAEVKSSDGAALDVGHILQVTGISGTTLTLVELVKPTLMTAASAHVIASPLTRTRNCSNCGALDEVVGRQCSYCKKMV